MEEVLGMRHTFRAVLLWAFVMYLGALAFVAQGQQLSQNPAKQQPQTTSSAPSEIENPPAAVVIDDRPIFYLNAPVGAYTAADRAAAIQQRILDLAKSGDVPVESVHVEERAEWSEIRSGNGLIMAVSDLDAQARGRARQQLAAENAEIIRYSARRYREAHTWKNLLLDLLYTALATLACGAFLWGLLRFRRAVRTRVEGWLNSRMSQPEVPSHLRLSAVYLWGPLLGLGTVFYWIIIVIGLQAYVTAVLRFFPQTEQASLRTTDWFASQFAIVGRAVTDYLPNLVLVIVIGAITYLVLRADTRIFDDIEAGRLKISGFYPEWARPTANLVRILVLALAAVVVFPYLPGAKSPAFQGISIFLGVLLSLGSSSAVANAVAGTILNYTRSFSIGDMVRIGDTFGEVVEKGLLVTRILTPKRETIAIPNGTVMGSAVKNYSTEAKTTGVALYTTVTIGYDAPWRRVHELLIGAALATQDIIKDPAPYVLQTALNDFYVAYELNVYTRTPTRMAEIYSELHQNIQDKFNEGGIEINSPHYTALRDGNTTTIPAGYVPESYQAPSFRVRTAENEAERSDRATERELA